MARKDQTKEKMNPSKANTNSCSSMSGIQVCGNMISTSADWDIPFPVALPSAANVFSPLDPLTAVTFLGRHYMFLTSPTCWDLHWGLDFILPTSRITLSGATCRDPEPTPLCLASQTFLWNLGESLHNPATHILHVSKTSTMRLIPRSASSSSGIGLPCTKHLQVSTGMNLGNHFFKRPCSSSALWLSLLEGKSFKWVYNVTPWSLQEWGSYHFWDALKATVHCLNANACLLFNGTSLLNTHSILVYSFSSLLFWADCTFSNPSAVLFLPILTVSLAKSSQW
jgi:hypothetical protein